MPRFAVLVTAFLIALAGASPGIAQDTTAGKAVFKKCSACHQIGENASNRAGPALNDLIGRTAGTFEGFKYGKDLVVAGDKGLVWTQELVAQFVADPKVFLRDYLDDGSAKSRMTFRLKDEKQRLDVAAYLDAVTGSGQATEETKAAPIETRSVDQVIADQVFDTVFLEDPAVVEAGKALWIGQCALCHGAKAYPGKAPKLKPRKYKPGFVFKRTYKGFRAMPGWRETFSIDEIREIVAYVKSPGFSP